VDHALSAAFYGPDARRTYISVTAALILPLGVALMTGLLTGLTAAALLWWWLPGLWLRVSLIAAASSALAAWLAMLRFWWLRRIDSIEADLFHLQAGQFAACQPVQIEQKIDGGRVLQIGKPPATRWQLLSAARIVLEGGTLSHRSLSGVFAPADVSAFQTWLVGQKYAAWRSPAAPQQGIEVTALGRAMFREAAGKLAPSPAPEASQSVSWRES
jgi:hypothetical protein